MRGPNFVSHDTLSKSCNAVLLIGHRHNPFEPNNQPAPLPSQERLLVPSFNFVVCVPSTRSTGKIGSCLAELMNLYSMGKEF